jgi:hypothetical protein
VTALEPCRLDPVASINRARLDGRDARDLLSAPALAELAAAAGLRPDRPLRSYLDRCLAEQVPAAYEVAEEFGTRLGRLLAALRAGDRTLKPEWDASWWDRWTGTRTVWLGGGLSGGAFGELVAARAAALVGPGCRVTVAPDPGDLPLVGAAHVAARPDGPALVLDFGHTLVKRAVAGYASGRLDSLRRLPAAPAPAEDAPGGPLAEAVAGLVAAAWTDAGRPPGPVVAAMASYIKDGQPVRVPLGTYTRLADVSADVQGWLAGRLRALLGTALPVVLLHDGTAAAQAVPPDPAAVVVLLGSSLGVGFPAHCADLAGRGGSWAGPGPRRPAGRS